MGKTRTSEPSDLASVQFDGERPIVLAGAQHPGPDWTSTRFTMSHPSGYEVELKECGAGTEKDPARWTWRVTAPPRYHLDLYPTHATGLSADRADAKHMALINLNELLLLDAEDGRDTTDDGPIAG